MKNKLIEFLEKEGCLDQFKKNYENEKRHIDTIDDYFIIYKKLKDAISCGFTFTETCEGFKYWKKIDNKWQDFLKEQQNG